MPYDPHNPTIERKLDLAGGDFGDTDCVSVTINGYEYGMNINYVPESNRDWFLQVFGDILTRVDKQARQEAKEDHEKRLRALCGLKD